MTQHSIVSTSNTSRIFRAADQLDDEVTEKVYASLTGTDLHLGGEVIGRIKIPETMYIQMIITMPGISGYIHFEERKAMNNLSWTQKLEIRHKAWLFIISIMGFIGLVDLVQFALSGVTVLHWLNDLLLIFSALALAITVVMVVMDE